MIKVVNLSLGRTGTMSLKHALEDLGLDKCYHFSDIFDHQDHIDIWRSLAKGEPIDWEALFEGYQSTVYWSTSYDYQFLLDKYPEMKFILTVREPEAWYKSTFDTVYSLNRPTLLRNIKFKIKGMFDPELRKLYKLWKFQETLLWQNTFKGRFHDKDFAIQQFEQHIENVKKNVPAERLLVYKIQQGWQPLCDFLQLPVPETDFPRVNDTASFVEWRKTVSVK
ncbi:MAG: hypothetical protein KAG20_11100 [Cocleimonas sp.]|nr:hypothetical protein [Cocleimonas sp.]